MSKIFDFLSGTQILEEVDSPINGHLTVVRDLAWGIHIKGGGLTQSGGVAKLVWQASLKEVLKSPFVNHHSLILGLGGGSIAKLIHNYWPDAKIIGVDIDPIIVDLGKKYMGLNKIPIDVHIDDSMHFLNTKYIIPNTKYSLICIDMYQGDLVPPEFETEKFINKINSLLSEDGIAIFNRLYYGEKRKEAQLFLNKLEKNFKRVDIVFPEANVMYICKKN